MFPIYGKYVFCHIRKSVRENWDRKKSLRQNLKSLNLVYSANEVLSAVAPEAAPMVRNHGYCYAVQLKIAVYRMNQMCQLPATNFPVRLIDN